MALISTKKTDAKPQITPQVSEVETPNKNAENTANKNAENTASGRVSFADRIGKIRLLEMVEKEGLRDSEIAVQFDIGADTVRSARKKFGIKRRKTKVVAKDLAERVKAGATAQELAEHYECSISTIYHKARKHDLTFQNTPSTNEEVLDNIDDDPFKADVEDGMSYAALSRKYGATIHYVKKKMEALGIERKKRSYSMSNAGMDQNELINKLVAAQVTPLQMAYITGMDTEALAAKVESLGLEFPRPPRLLMSALKNYDMEVAEMATNLFRTEDDVNEILANYFPAK